MLPDWNRLRKTNSSGHKKKSIVEKNRKDAETFVKKCTMKLKTYHLKELENNVKELTGSRLDRFLKNTQKAITTTSVVPQYKVKSPFPPSAAINCSELKM